jgi:hypothetical protein
MHLLIGSRCDHRGRQPLNPDLPRRIMIRGRENLKSPMSLPDMRNISEDRDHFRYADLLVLISYQTSNSAIHQTAPEPFKTRPGV